MFVPYAGEKKNRVFYDHFWRRVDTILEDVFVAEITV